LVDDRAALARSCVRRRAASLDPVELGVRRLGALRELARQHRAAHGGLARASKREVLARGPVEIDRLLRVLLAVVEAPEALVERSGEGMKLDRASARSLLQRERLDGLRCGDRLGTTRKRSGGIEQRLGSRDVV